MKLINGINRSIFMMSLLFTAGCFFPSYYVGLPALHGRVVDAQSRPVAMATIKIKYVSGINGLRNSPIILTGPDGRFSSDKQTKFFVYIVPEDLSLPKYDLAAVRGNLRSPPTQISGAIQLFCIPTAAAEKDLGDLQLQ